jgi:integrase/recombinase XerD
MKLADGLSLYLLRRREDGLTFERPETLIVGFCRQVGDIDLGEVRTQDVLTYLDAPLTSTITWRSKYQMLLRFFEFWSHRGAISHSLMPPPKPLQRQSFVPYVYSRAELRALLKATVQNEKPIRSIERQTLRTIILLLYGTGAMVGEMLSLSRQDVNLKASLVTIRSRNVGRSRQIPIGSDLRDVLQKYLNWRGKRNYQSDLLFVTKHDRRIAAGTLTVNFQRLRRFASVSRVDGCAQQPRLNDLKFTFAVHRITSWIKNGADLNRMLPALAAYMGQVGLGSTERYLAMTPERFRKQLNKLSPIRRAGRWRNDKKLMQFLATL